MHSKADLRNFLMAEVDVQVAISLGWPKSYCFMAEGFAHGEAVVAEGDPPGAINPAHSVIHIVQHGR